MIVIDEFDEWFYFRSFRDSFLAHSSCDFTGITLDSGDEGVTERMAFGSIIERFEDDGFSACVAASSDEGDLTGFQDYTYKQKFNNTGSV